MVAVVASLVVVAAVVAESHQEECYCWRRTIRMRMATVVAVVVLVARHELLPHTGTQQPAEEEERRMMNSSPAWVLHALQKQTTTTKTFHQLVRVAEHQILRNSYLADEAGDEQN
jgi:hypothetical protein